MSELDKYHYHEVLDRCHVMLCHIEDHMISHPAIDADEQAKQKLEEASRLIAEVYQWAGSERRENENV